MRSVAALAVLVLAGSFAQARPVAEGSPAPPVEAKLLDGANLTPADYSGKVLVVNFWATWCGPCRAEMPALEAFYEKHRAEGLQVIVISMDDPKDEAKVRDVMRAYTFPAALGRDAKVKGYGRIWRLPLTFVIDRRGVLRKDGWYGDPGLDLPLLEKTVTPLLAAP
jgi:thiol-disulfide isomerase/thioredoxin